MNNIAVKKMTSSCAILHWWHVLLCTIIIMAVAGCFETKILRQLPMINTTEEISLSEKEEKLVSIVVSTKIEVLKKNLYNSGAINKNATIFLAILNKNPAQNFLVNFKNDNITLKPASLGFWQEDYAYDPQDTIAHTYYISIANIEINNRTDTAQLYAIYGQDESGECTGVRWYFLRNGDNWEIVKKQREPGVLCCD